MAHIASIGAGLFSDLSVYNGTTPITVGTSFDSQAEFDALFATETDTPGAATFSRIKNVREFPAMGTPPNIVNVPVYGQKTTQQIQGQADSPSMEVQMNFVADQWKSGSVLGGMVGDGTLKAFRFCLLNSEPASYASTIAGLGTAKGGSAGTPACANSYYYFIGKIEALVVNPQLTDANTATVTITVQSAFYGAYTATA